MKQNYNKYLLITLCITFLMMLGTALFIYFVDPNQIYHKHNTYVGNQRYEIAGIARNHDYDAAIIGSSMCMNHYPEQVDSLFGWKTKNFSMMGITHDEYNIFLPYLIRQGKVKNIIFGIDLFSFISELGAIPKELYDDNIWNDISYLLSYKGLEQTIKYLRNPKDEKNLYHFNSPVKEAEVIKDYKEVESQQPKIYNYQDIIKNFNNHVLPHIKSSPKQIKWYIYWPPYNIGEFTLMQKQEQLESALKAKEYITQQLLKLPNVEIYDFQKEPLITKMDEFMDLRHHSHKYNRLIIESINKKNYLVKLDSIENCNVAIKKLSGLYNF